MKPTEVPLLTGWNMQLQLPPGSQTFTIFPAPFCCGVVSTIRDACMPVVDVSAGQADWGYSTTTISIKETNIDRQIIGPPKQEQQDSR